MKVLLVGDRRQVDRIVDAPVPRWEVTIVDSPEGAFQRLSQNSYRAVVALGPLAPLRPMLAEIRMKFPEIARLSMADATHAGLGANMAYHLIPMGCDATVLAGLLERSTAVHEAVNKESVRRFVGRVETLPSVPKVYLEVQELVSREDVTAAAVARAIEADPALSLKMLQVVNSVTFGLRQRIATVQQAVSLLGVELIKSLVLSTQVFAAAEQGGVQGFSLEQFQAYSTRVARLAQQFSRSRGLGDEAFTAGLLLDVGKLVLAMKQPDLFTQVLLRVAETGESCEAVERELLGVTHSEAGGHLLSLWGIPFSIVECVAFHHQAGDRIHGPMAAAVHAADALLDIGCCGEPESRLDLSVLERGGVLGELDDWRRVAQDMLN